MTIGGAQQARRRTRGVVVAVMVALAGLVVAPAARAEDSPTTAGEAQLVTRINELRGSKGLQPLTVHAGLAVVARSWTEKMRGLGDISHNPNLAKEVTATWRKLGENVGVGPDVESLHQAFVNSPGHYRNLVDPVFDSIAVTIVQDGDELYVTEQFMDLVDPAPTTTAVPATTTSTLVSSAPLQLALGATGLKGRPIPKPVKKTTRRK